MKVVNGFNEAKRIIDRSINLDDSLNFTAVSGSGKKTIQETVRDIIEDVQKHGDNSLRAYNEKFDHVKIDKLEVTRDEIDKAYREIDSRLLSDLKMSARRIKRFHMNCMKSFEKGFEENGIGRWIRPLTRAGIYVPGGTASYPSTVLMTAIPASVAGVKEIVMVSPPQNNGLIPAITLVAADIAGVKRIFKTGGAQAIAALAYGTETIPKADKICGPGNIYVAVAKKLVYGIVDIDGIQGPSEVIVIGDSSAKPDYCAADLLAQAEHDSMASAIFITDSAKLAAEVKKEINRQLALLHRKEILKQAIDNNCLLIIVANINEAIDLVNLYAPEHLLLMIRRAKSYLRKVQNVGCIFLGEKSPVAIGDYVAGPSHVLPTGGTARFTSALSVESFQKIINYVELAKKDQRRLARATYNIAMAEGLTAHAEAVKIRFKNII
jgi:histidinol dehydrogenase